MDAYLHHGAAGAPMMTEQVPVRVEPRTQKGNGLGATDYRVRYLGKWRRVFNESFGLAIRCEGETIYVQVLEDF